MAPGQLSRERRDNLGLRVNLGKSHHMSKALGGESPPVFLGQAFRQLVHNLLAVSGPLPMQFLPVDAPSDAPIQKGDFRVYGGGRGAARIFDELPQVGQQSFANWRRGGLFLAFPGAHAIFTLGLGQGWRFSVSSWAPRTKQAKV